MSADVVFKADLDAASVRDGLREIVKDAMHAQVALANMSKAPTDRLNTALDNWMELRRAKAGDDALNKLLSTPAKFQDAKAGARGLGQEMGVANRNAADFASQLQRASIGGNIVRAAMGGVVTSLVIVNRLLREYANKNAGVKADIDAMDSAWARLEQRFARANAGVPQAARGVLDWYNRKLEEGDRAAEEMEDDKGVGGFLARNSWWLFGGFGPANPEDTKARRLQEEDTKKKEQQKAEHELQFRSRQGFASDPLGLAFEMRDRIIFDAERVVQEKYGNDPLLAAMFLGTEHRRAEEIIRKATAEAAKSATKAAREARLDREEREFYESADAIDLERRRRSIREEIEDQNQLVKASVLQAKGQTQAARAMEIRLKYAQLIRQVERDEDVWAGDRDGLIDNLRANMNLELEALRIQSGKRDVTTGRVFGGVRGDAGGSGTARLRAGIFGTGVSSSGNERRSLEFLRQMNDRLKKIEENTGRGGAARFGP